jgi:LmbE family N-acetylglucosaminyl deacetylase
MVFGAHPDDMEIGMGGTIAKYTQKDNEVLMVLVSLPNNPEKRLNEAQNAAKILGAEFCSLNLTSNDLIFSRQLVQICDKAVSQFSPDVVYTHWIHDSHQDHISVANAVIASTRKNNCSLYMYEQTIPGGIVPFGFRTQYLVNITDYINLKINSIRSHESQMKINGSRWIDGIKGRAAYRGYQIDANFAEAFEVIKIVEKFG